MDNLERQLKDALGRKEPPAWFEAKVLAAARERGGRRTWLQRVMLGSWLRFATAIAAVGLVASGVVWQQHERRVQADRERVERIAGEAAKERLMLALKTTRNKLERIQERVAAIQREN